MELRLFLQTILPPSGPYFISAKHRRWKDTSVQSIDEAVAKIEDYKKSPRDIYIATASYKTAKAREQQDVNYKKVFYIDIDCSGDNRQYDSKNEAFSEIKRLTASRAIAPPSLLIDSGRGLHAYWVLSQLVPEAHWTILAKAFKRALLAVGLKVDPQVTADSTRVMRVPTTTNQKNQKVCSVLLDTGNRYTAKQFADAMSLAKYGDREAVGGSNVTPIRKLPPGAFLEDRTSDLIASNAAPRYFSEIISSCALASRERENGGAGSSYPLWFSMLNLLAFCEDGADWWRPISSAHETYSESACEARYEAAVADKESGKLRGATTCETFHGCAPEVCGSCPHWSDPERGKSWSSPIHFGLRSAVKIALGQSKDSYRELPFPYVHLTNGTGLQVEKDDGNGGTVPEVARVMRYKLDWPEVLGAEPELYFSCEMDLYGTAKRVYIRPGFLHSNDRALYGQLTEQGVVLRESEIKHFKRIVVDWYQRVEAAKGRAPLVKQYGWVPGDSPRFAVGEEIYTANAPVSPTRMVEEGMNTQLTPAGTEQEWRRLVKAALQAEHIETEVLFASAFASPLVAFTGVAGCIVSAVSAKSGTGKSLALRLGQSVWGNPAACINSMNDTPNSLVRRMSLSNSLPAYWDEVRINDKESLKFVDFLYRCTQGREKSRMNAKAELQETPVWKTMMVCASNCGLQEHINHLDKSTNAAMLRVLEFDVAPLDERKMADGHQFWALDKNYGHIGRKYAQYLVDNRDKVAKAVIDTVAALSSALKASADERFYLSSIATLLVGASIARNQGWVDFNVQGIRDFLLALYKEQVRGIREETQATFGSRSSLGILREFIDLHADQTLVTDLSIPASRRSACSPIVLPKRNPVVIRYGVDDGTIIIDLATLRAWLYAHHGGPKAHVMALESVGAELKNGRLLSGIRPPLGVNVTKRCLVVKRNLHTEFLFEDAPARSSSDDN